MNHSWHIGDILAGIATYSSFLSFLPTVLSSIAALGSILWYGIRIYEYFKNKQVPKVEHD